MALVAEGFFMRLGFGIISFAMPLYARRLGLSLAETGALLALTGVVKVALKPLAGWAADRVGAKRGLLAALSLRSAVSFLFSFATLPWQLYSIRTLHGLSTSLRDPAVNALIAEHGDEKSMASTFAWYFTAKSLASSLGKAVAGGLIVWTGDNYPLVFLITWVISSLTLPAVALFVPGTRPALSSALSAAQRADAAAAARRAAPSGGSLYRRASGLVGLGFLISVTGSMIDRFYPILATEYAHMTPARAGLIYLASALVAVAVGPLFGWLGDRFGQKPTVAARSVANAGSSLLYLFVPNAAGFTAGKLLDDGGRAGFRPVWGALKADVSNLNKNQRAQMMGVMDVGDDAGDVLGPILGGFLWDSWGIVGLLATRIALACITECYAVIVLWRRAQPVGANSRQLPTARETASREAS
jgi:MFS family permease